MANRVTVPVTNFESLSPPWNLSSLDSDLLALQGALNDSSLGYMVNGPDTGTANHYVLATPSYGVPSNYNQGMTVAFLPANTNLAGSSTLNVAGLGVQPIQYAGGNAPAGWIIAGQPTLVVYIGSAFQLVASPSSFGAPPPQCGQLLLSGASPSNTIQFIPFKGDQIKINGSLYQIPAAGISALANNCYINGVSGQTLTNNTLYRVYLFNNSGTLTLDFSTTGHATSASVGNVGVEIKSGDDTRSFIGLTYPSGTNQFYDQPNNRLTRSWFNPVRSSLLVNSPVTVTATTPTATALSASAVCIANESLSGQATWYGTATTSTNVTFNLYLNGSASANGSAITTISTTSKNENITVLGAWNPVEGLSTVALYAFCSSANTATGTAALAGMVG